MNLYNPEKTLKQNLDIYYQNNPDFYSKETIDGKLQEYILPHDALHIIFNCNTDLLGELKLEIITLFCTDIKWNEYYQNLNNEKIKNDFGKVIKSYSNSEYFKLVIFAIKQFIKAVFTRVKMKRIWQVYEYDKFLECPLQDIRKQFNISV
jgi:ubiquinone biosynthesis protein Coq4